MAEIKVGIIGGTGLGDLDIIQGVTEKVVETPFGMPSDSLKLGSIDGFPCVVLARHSRGYNVSPSYINYRANIWALKEVGCTHIIVSTACGSLREEIRPGDLVILDQFIDRTARRPHITFYDGTPGGPTGVCFIPMGDPFCPRLRQILIDGAKELNLPYHETGTTVCIEGPRFSTKAESNLYRSWGANIVNMTTVPEVTLAKELGLCYAALALPTDYDCWRETGESVSVDLVMRTLKENAEKAARVLRYAVNRIYKEEWTEYLTELKKVASSSVM